MSLDSIRQSLVTAVEAAKTGFTDYTLVIEYSNVNKVDTQTQHNPYLMVDTKFTGGEQVNLSNHPTHRWTGMLELTACIKCGQGTAKANKLLDHFYPQLQAKTFGAVRTYMADFGRGSEQLGWYRQTLYLPFWCDQITQ